MSSGLLPDSESWWLVQRDGHGRTTDKWKEKLDSNSVSTFWLELPLQVLLLLCMPRANRELQVVFQPLDTQDGIMNSLRLSLLSNLETSLEDTFGVLCLWAPLSMLIIKLMRIFSETNGTRDLTKDHSQQWFQRKICLLQKGLCMSLLTLLGGLRNTQMIRSTDHGTDCSSLLTLTTLLKETLMLRHIDTMSTTLLTITTQGLAAIISESMSTIDSLQIAFHSSWWISYLNTKALYIIILLKLKLRMGLGLGRGIRQDDGGR